MCFGTSAPFLIHFCDTNLSYCSSSLVFSANFNFSAKSHRCGWFSRDATKDYFHRTNLPIIFTINRLIMKFSKKKFEKCSALLFSACLPSEAKSRMNDAGEANVPDVTFSGC